MNNDIKHIYWGTYIGHMIVTLKFAKINSFNNIKTLHKYKMAKLVNFFSLDFFSPIFKFKLLFFFHKPVHNGHNFYVKHITSIKNVLKIHNFFFIPRCVFFVLLGIIKNNGKNIPKILVNAFAQIH